MNDTKPVPPLTPAVLYILMALVDEDRHGYGIMKQVEAESRGRIRMGPGTLYGSVGRMIEAGLIAESEPRVDARLDDQRRIYYRITDQGRQVLTTELERYRDVVTLANAKRLSTNGGADVS